MHVVLLATGWGPKFGGINAFNRDLCVGLADELRGAGRIFCAVPDPSGGDQTDASLHNVTLIPIQNKRHKDEFDDSWVHEVTLWLRKHANSPAINWWVGHDVISGDAALRAASLAGGSAALIHHMSYVNYQAYKHDNAVDADSKHHRQEVLFGQQAALFAVGPLLQRACREISGREVIQLVPGFTTVPQINFPGNSVVAVTFGRMEQTSDRIKQGRLAVAGFGEAIKQASSFTVPIKRLARARLYMIGLDADWRVESEEVQKLADRYAKRAVNVLALPFDNDREGLLRRLSGANIALMLSWHEGFGLTGWEAIGAEVPLIVTEHSGLYEIIEGTLQGAGTGCVQSVDVRGRRGPPGTENFEPEDLQAVSAAILRVAAELDQHRQNARHLKELLIAKLGCTWRHTARQFLNALPRNSLISGENLPTGDQSPGIDSNALSDPFTVHPPDNPVPRCAELTVGIAQGSIPTSFHLLPELRFGLAKFDVDGLLISYGVAEALLQAELEGCKIAPGTRLGDRRDEHPEVSAHGDNTWVIRGPSENGILTRRALGSEPLCLIEAKSTSYTYISLNLSCLSRSLVYNIVDRDQQEIPITERRVLEAFFNKCLNVKDGVVTLSRATLTAREEPR